VTAVQDGNRRVIEAADAAAGALGLRPGMAVAQAMAVVPGLHVLEADPTEDAASLERLARCNGLIWSTAEAVLAAGTSVVLDTGGMRRADRERIRQMAEAKGLSLQWHFVDAPQEVRRARVAERNAAKGETFVAEVSPEMFDRLEALYEAPAPAELDWELWQGPAPRTAYRDNVVHYNWHWFTRWGTGEICNNGTHEIDIARLALGADYPTAVMSTGGRHHFQDDWEFPDTQDVTFEFAGGKTIIWQGTSCNGLKPWDRGRGTAIYGTGGSMILDRDGYLLFDTKQKLVRQSLEPRQGNGVDLIGDDAATSQHMDNFLAAVRTGAPLRAPIADGAKSVHLCHLGNIAQYTGRKLRVDPATGRFVDDAEAMTYWSREYAPGWAIPM